MATMIDEPQLRAKMMGCWLGKAVGGTLGMPYEGVDCRLNLDFYDPVPTEMLPNDDLDLQVVYACLMDRLDEPRVGRDVFIPAWTDHIGMSPDEYGVCKRNLKLGLKPPLTGRYDNWFEAGMGAAIRTEIWACLAPGDPPLAAAYAYEDACLDHAGEGIHAARFLAALESMAFVESNIDALLDGALGFIPAESAVRRAIEDTRRWWAELGDWVAVQKRIMAEHGHENFTNVTHNLAFTILGWLAGEGDFGKSICIAVNCGQDTDCTGATLGALMGIIDPACIDPRWLAPIGRDLVLSPSIRGVEHPPTLDGFTDLVLDLKQRIGGKRPSPPQSEQSTDHLAIHAEVGFLPIGRSFNQATQPDVPGGVPQPPGMPEQMTPATFPGTIAVWPYDKVDGGTLVVRYRVHFDQAAKAKVLFNTPQHVRVFIDGKPAFAREGGRMCPAMHRAPLNQMVKHAFEAGDHEIVAFLRKPAEPEDLTWVVGLGTDCGQNVCDDWLVGVFQRG